MPKVDNLRILSDTSSLEIFINDGVEVFTTRIYDSMIILSCEWNGLDTDGMLTWYTLQK